MFARKPISHESVPGALAKAERYRLLNEPTESESICRDVLEIEPDNQAALIHLVLALTDQIPADSRAFHDAISIAGRLQGAYNRAYYSGICWERRAKGHHQSRGQSIHQPLYEWLVKALHYYEEAERFRSPGNDDPVLRWNACVRYLERHRELAPRPDEIDEPVLSE
jgi:hypothetical protein